MGLASLEEDSRLKGPKHRPSTACKLQEEPSFEEELNHTAIKAHLDSYLAAYTLQMAINHKVEVAIIKPAGHWWAFELPEINAEGKAISQLTSNFQFLFNLIL